MIRSAIPTDAPRLLELGLAQYNESVPLCAFDALSFLEYIERLDRNGILLVAEIDSRVVGMVGVSVSALNYNRNVLIFSGALWYCEPTFRKVAGLAMMEAMERAARERGVHFGVVGVDYGERSPALSRLYRRSGYKPSQYIHIKRL